MLGQNKHLLALSFAPSERLYTAVRAAFVAKGTTLNAWCTSQGINRQTAARSLKGERNGSRSRELRARLTAAAGIE